jgi:scyllo-inositol 2-dehydrogenase (NADP+)
MQVIQVGLVGFGFSGQVFHAPLLEVLEGYTIRKVLSSNPDKVKSQLGDVEVVSNMEQLLADPLIDLVIITTPNELHFPQAKAALLAGKHVVLEKPMVNTVAEAEQLVAIAEKEQRMLSIYQNRRWDNDFLTIKQLLAENKLGKLHTYEAHFDRYRPTVVNRWREQEKPGSGMLFDLGSHLIDQVLHLFGPPQFVQADVIAQRAGAVVDDYFHVTLGYDHLRAILRSSSLVPAHDLRYILHGSKGSFIKYGIDSQEAALIAGEKPIGEQWGSDVPEKYGQLTVYKDGQFSTEVVPTVSGSYVAYYQAVYDHLVSGAPCPVPAKEGLLTIKVIEAALTSSEEKRTIVF